MNPLNFLIFKKVCKYCYVTILIFTFSACSKGQSSDNYSMNQAVNLSVQKEEIKNTLTQMWNAIEKEDIERYASYVHPDFTQFGETDSVLSVGKEAEVKSIANWLKNTSDIRTEMIDPIVTIRGSTAWIVYYWSDHGLTNGAPFASKGKSTRIFVRENGKWLCIHGHYTLLP